MDFKDAARIPDSYHLREHVWAAGRALYPQEKPAERWVEECLGYLHASSAIGLLRPLERRQPVRPAPEQAVLDELMGYVPPPVSHTDYVDFRAPGYVIGSGMIESRCKQAVVQRLKGPRTQWSKAGSYGGPCRPPAQRHVGPLLSLPPLQRAA